MMSILIITSLFFPAVNAAPNETEEPPVGAVFAAAPAIPAISEFVYAGVVVLIAGVSVVEIGKHLNTHWEDPAESWDKFAKRVSTELEKVFAKQWVKVTSPDGEALMTATYECYTATAGSSGGKKDDKWYFEARRNHGEIEINLDRMNEEQAVKEMGRGKNIMTLSRELAQKLVGHFEGLPEQAAKDLKFDGDHDPAAGKFLHLHYTAHEMRLHCWIWKDI